MCFICIKQLSFWRLVLKYKVVQDLLFRVQDLNKDKALSITLYPLSLCVQFVTSRMFSICLGDKSKCALVGISMST